jgi:predicted deacetylase
MQSLCVVVHAVAEARRGGCERVAAAVREVAPVPLTLLAVPRFHHAAPTPSFEQWLTEHSARGDELALHGHTHLDDGTPRGAFDRLRRRVYTRGEGEFWDLDAADAATRLRAGIDWFAQHGWPLRGFVAPAWLLGPGAWAALRSFREFAYTATLRHLHLLPGDARIASQAIVYSTSTAWRRASSIVWAAALERMLADNPVMRFELHPYDADHAGVRRSWQHALEQALRQREASTVAELCERWRQDSGPTARADDTVRAPTGAALKAD